MEDGRHTPDSTKGSKSEEHSKMNGSKLKRDGASNTSNAATPNGSQTGNSRPPSLSPDEHKAASESTATPTENAPTQKPSRKASQKNMKREPVLFSHLPDVREEACTHFQVIHDCLYGSKNMGASEHDALDCDCAEEWRGDMNHACGEDSDCINRATKMECVDGDCNCGAGCQNQRFQRKQYADVSVIKTEKKGFGLRANTDLQVNDFIFEYIGEVINEPTFRSRMIKYDKEGIKHFYFMSLTKSEFVDATKKGNLGRFCNHSCNPNCYVDKWVVGDKLRMGIFAGRAIKAGEELVFNYNVDRYGADPQPCYCGEPNCTGFIGGKTQTERATKLPPATIEALGIEDGDSWDTAVAATTTTKKPRKKKATEDDEEYINRFEPRGLDEEGVTKVMATLMQCKEKWIAVKLLGRLQNADNDHVRNRVVKMHGYQILKTTLNTFKEDTNVVLQILDILYQLPRITKNKITDSNIEAAVEPLTHSDHEDVASQSKRLLQEWSRLETAYRIPRKKLDPSAPVITNSFEDDRRNVNHEEHPSRPVNPFENMVVPTGPRSNIPQRNMNYFNNQRPRKLPTNLPAGWFVTTDSTGKYYFYDKSGHTQWQRPTTPAVDVPKASAKVEQNQKALQDIIDSLTKEPTPRHSANQTPKSNTPVPDNGKKEKWRSLPIEKQMKIYENTLFPHVKYVMDKFHRKLPKEDLKRFGREINKKLVASDYKNRRVDDPTTISSNQARKIKKYVKDFFDRAVVKHRENEQRAAQKAGSTSSGAPSPNNGGSAMKPRSSLGLNGASSAPVKNQQPDADGDVVLTDVEDEGDNTPATSSPDRKRKRAEEREVPAPASEAIPSPKRVKEDSITEDSIPSPPPPPPPPTDTPLTEEERSMREQEEALMRENEEAQRLEDEEAERRVSVAVQGAAAATSKVNGVNGTNKAHISEVSPAVSDESGGMDVDRDEQSNKQGAQQKPVSR